jgi:hypothetical protein
VQSAIQLISVLAWPATVLVLAIVFRGSVRDLVKRLSAITVGGVRGELREGLDKVEGEIRSLPGPKRDGADLSALDRLLRIAEISPRAAVLEAWRDVEVGTKHVTEAYGLADPKRSAIAGSKAIHDLVSRGLLPRNVQSVYQQLRRLRSRAAHAPDSVVTPEEAVRYIEAANDFYSMFGFLLKQARPAGSREGGNSDEDVG